MITADTNVWVAYVSGATGRDIELLDAALGSKSAGIIPVVLAELLSSPSLPEDAAKQFVSVPLIEIIAGHWERAGRLRAELFRSGHKPKLMDTLIAQTCLDHKLQFLTRDADFKPFLRYGLYLL